MGLTCSLLGHDFGEPEVEREREERGNEVVETVREVRVCERCGSEQVVSENTEVRSVRPDPTESASRSTGGASEGDTSEPTTAETEPETERESGLDSAVERVDDSGASGVEGEFENVSAEEDDGVILDDDTGDEPGPDRDPGQWPDADDTRQNERDAAGATDASAGPDREGDAAVETDADAETDAAADPAPEQEDAEVITADGTAADAAADAESGDDHEPWPDVEGEDEGFDAQPTTDGVDAETASEAGDGEDVEYVEAGFEAADSIDPERAEPVQTGGTLVCPQCGHQTAANGSSLRAGDICPECRKGYLSEE